MTLLAYSEEIGGAGTKKTLKSTFTMRLVQFEKTPKLLQNCSTFRGRNEHYSWAVKEPLQVKMRIKCLEVCYDIKITPTF